MIGGPGRPEAAAQPVDGDAHFTVDAWTPPEEGGTPVESRYFDDQRGGPVGIGVGADGEAGEGIGVAARDDREGRRLALVDDRRAGVEAQEIANGLRVQPGVEPDGRLAVGEGQQKGGGRGAEDAWSGRRIAQVDDAAGVGEGLQHAAEQALRIVRRIGEPACERPRGEQARRE